MNLNVADRGRFIASFRYVEVSMMETAAAWIPTTAEMEVKVLFGRHLSEYAHHADALGKRAFELRLPLHHTLAPAQPYVILLQDLRGLERTAERVGALYDGVVAGLERRYRGYLERTDALLDAPSVTVLERILAELSRQRREADGLSRELGLSRSGEAFAQREGQSEFLA